MSKIKISDFYYGAILSMLLNNGIRPILVESGQNRQIYDLGTDRNNCILFMKYRADKQDTKTPNYKSWVFTFTDQDKLEIKNYIRKGSNLMVVLICGVTDLSESEVAVIDQSETQKIFELGKGSVTINRIKHEMYYRIPIGGGRENAMLIRANRFEELF
ncbi:MAG: hypothetical protein GX352_05200 [Clostridiales bacterium]|nr:hypothetical protein [Clostridiales bacterium]